MLTGTGDKKPNDECDKSCRMCKEHFERNNYYYGKLMTAKDFFAEQNYVNQKRWLVNRAVLGWGVVCGLKVQHLDAEKPGGPPRIEVGTGMAIDCCGREIVVCKPLPVPLVPEADPCKDDKRDHYDGEGRARLAVCLQYRECKAEPVQGRPDACDREGRQEFNRIRDSFEIKVRFAWKDKGEGRYGKFCPLFDPEALHKDTHMPEALYRSHLMPADLYLGRKLAEGCPECPQRQCVVLAEVTIDRNNPSWCQIDQSFERPLVYNNQLLYGLVDCYHGDLPRVVWINWKHDKTYHPDFLEHKLVEEGVRVRFDRKMHPETINEDTFLLQLRMTNSETGHSRFEDIPGRVSYDPHTSTATFRFSREWQEDAFRGYASLKKVGGKFMVRLLGDFILDEEKPGKALDGNFLGARLPSGNGTQGGDFVSWFQIERLPESQVPDRPVQAKPVLARPAQERPAPEKQAAEKPVRRKADARAEE